MSKKILLVLVYIITFFSFSRLIYASSGVIINEINYDADAGDIDYIEVKNTGADDVDLTSLKLLVDNSASNHSINNSSGSSVLHSGDYGVIAMTSVLQDYTNKYGTTGNIFTSSFSLPNDTAKVEINDGDKTNPISSVTYNSTQGASGDGNSLQLVNGSWLPALPTPGVENVNNNSGGSSGNSGGGSGSVSSGGGSSPVSIPVIVKPKIVEIPKIKTKIIINSTTNFINIPITLDATTLGLSGEKLYYGKYFWNFGDGDSKEINVNQSQKFYHTYYYAGDYNITLEYYQNFYSDTPDASAEIGIKVIPADVSITAVGDEKDFFVELTNNSTYDADISHWVLSEGDKSFNFPKNSIIPTKKKIILSPKITNFTFIDKSNLKLLLPSGEVAFDYGLFLNPKPIEQKIIQKKVNSPVVSNTIDIIKNIDEQKNIPENIDLSASAINSDKNKNYGVVGGIFWFGLVGISSLLIWSLRKRMRGFKGDGSEDVSEEFEVSDE